MIKILLKKTLLSLRHSKINSNYVSPSSLKGQFILVQNSIPIDAKTEIGSYTYIGKNCNITKRKIGRYCTIANNVLIGQVIIRWKDYLPVVFFTKMLTKSLHMKLV